MLKLLDFHNIYRKVMKIGRWELGQGFFTFLFFQIYQTIGDFKVNVHLCTGCPTKRDSW